MLRVELTQNYTGVRIQGSHADLDQLVDAFYSLTVSEDDAKHAEYQQISVRVLGLCYDIRHAAMGEREIVLADSGLDREWMKDAGRIVPAQNVELACNYLYPEMCYAMMALNELIELRICALTKGRYANDVDKAVIWDTPILCVRVLQAAFAECMKRHLEPNNYTRWHNLMNKHNCFVRLMAHQYMDVLNVRHIIATKDRREKAFVTTVKRIAECATSSEYHELDQAVREAARECGCDVSDIRLSGFEYSMEIDW